MTFRLESSESFNFPNFDTWVRVYQLENTDFRLVFVNVPGPLVSTSIVVPTLCATDNGIPHTLEHLVFCGSKSYPLRGYLDNLASRCLSTGTNAYTCEDHTCYEITTAGSEGMETILPVFIDHIFNPTLEPEQFMTEVYHVDGDGKDQGVVYCEMAARENTESDLLDLNLRRMLFGNKGTYAKECGGSTDEIRKLTNEQIIAYHSQYYNINNVTAIICGPARINECLQKLSSIFSSVLSESPAVPHSIEPVFSQSGFRMETKTVQFPSELLDYGSVGYAWNGPPSDDCKTIISLEVLFRHFNDNPSSLFQQRFVEREDPYCTDIDIELKSFVTASIMMIFSGVPLLEAEKEQDDESDAEGTSDGSSRSSAMGADKSEEGPSYDLFDGTVFSEQLLNTIREFVESGLKEPNEIKKTIERHNRKIFESLEESPLETLTGSIVPDIVRYHFCAASRGMVNGRPKIGTRLGFMNVFEQLLKEPVTYWKGLAKRYLLDQPVFEVKMLPDTQLAKKLEDEKTQREKIRLKTWSKTERNLVKATISNAVAKTKVNLPEGVKTGLPPIPDVSQTEPLGYEMENFQFKEARPYSGSQIVVTEGIFCNLGFFLSVSSVPDNLRPYLPLFQELLFQSPLEFLLGKKVVRMDYKEVSKYVSEKLVSHSCGVGMGNSYFSAEYLTQVLCIFATCDPNELDQVARFVSQVILFTQFTKDRIITVLKNLTTSISDCKRDGNAMMNAILNRIVVPKISGDELGSNDCAISIFKQEKFLAQMLKDVHINSKCDEIISALNQLRSIVIAAEMSCPSFFRVGLPINYSLNRTGTPSTKQEISDEILNIWQNELEDYLNKNAGNKRKRKKREVLNVFPYKRSPFKIKNVDNTFGKAVIVPIRGIGSSYFSQIVECDLFSLAGKEDYFPTVLLAEILSRPEGPLYTGVRGQG